MKQHRNIFTENLNNKEKVHSGLLDFKDSLDSIDKIITVLFLKKQKNDTSITTSAHTRSANP
jgi:hypothetical protein